MLAAVWRVVMVRVRPDVILSFKRYGSEDCENSFNSLNGSNSSTSTFRSAWKNDNGVFSWADKGQWETVQHRPDSEEANWFRIGFEPVFSAYTKRGAWFVVISLLEVGQRFREAVLPYELYTYVVSSCFRELRPNFHLFLRGVSGLAGNCTVPKALHQIRNVESEGSVCKQESIQR